MAKFFGKVGYVHVTNVGNGVHREVPTERDYYGDVLQPARRLTDETKVNSDVEARNMISVLADDYATENIFAIRYVWWGGARWKVTYVEAKRPRLILTLGGVYNGPKVAAPGPP
jgi:hypothetical protein